MGEDIAFGGWPHLEGDVRVDAGGDLWNRCGLWAESLKDRGLSRTAVIDQP